MGSCYHISKMLSTAASRGDPAHEDRVSFASTSAQANQSANVRWGILGAGNIARHAHAPAIRHAANAELWAVASRELSVAEQVAHATGARRAHGSYDVLLEDDEIDAVYIGLPNGLHEAWTIAAARAGKHVLCDKSLTFDGPSAERMLAACASTGVRLMEGFMYRHHPQWDRVRDLVAAGAIGSVRAIHAWLSGTAPTHDHRWSRELGGGALYDVTTYGINIARLVTREEPDDVRAVAELAPGGVDRTSSVVMRFPSGVVATAGGSLCAAAAQGCRIVGEIGELVVRQPIVTTFAPTEIVLVRDGWSESMEVAGANHFLHQIEHFSACVRDPARALWPAEDGLANTLACARARAGF